MKSIIVAVLAVLFLPFFSMPVDEPVQTRETNYITIPDDENGEIPNTYIISIPPGEKKEVPDVYVISAPEGNPVDTVKEYVVQDDVLYEDTIPTEDNLQIIQGKKGEVQTAYCTVYFVVE